MSEEEQQLLICCKTTGSSWDSLQAQQAPEIKFQEEPKLLRLMALLDGEGSGRVAGKVLPSKFHPRFTYLLIY